MQLLVMNKTHPDLVLHHIGMLQVHWKQGITVRLKPTRRGSWGFLSVH